MLETFYDSGKELLKDGEKYLEDSFGTDIDIFTESQKKLNQGKDTQKEKTQEKLIDLKSSVILSKIKNQLKKGFENFKEKINSISQIILNDEDKQKHIKTAEKEYNDIMKTLNSYKNDGDFQKGYEKINTKVTEWISKLDKQDSNSIIDSVKLSLENIRADMGEVNGKTKEEISQTKIQIKEKYQESVQDNEIETMLTKFGVPAGIAGIIVTFLSWLGIGTKEKTMFTKMMSFAKNPLDGVKGLFGFGKTEKKEESETISKIVKGELKESGDLASYKNENLEIQLENNKIKSIKIDGVEYKFNQENLGNINFIQNDRDLLKIGDKEIDLFVFIEKIKENKDSYILSENFNNSDDLRLEIV